MFEDIKHKNKIVDIDGKKFIKKSFNSNNFSLLRKEYKIERALSEKSITPYVRLLYGIYFYEELVNIKKIDLTQDFIKDLSLVLRELHRIKIDYWSESIKKAIKNDFIKKDCYELFLLYQEIFKRLPSNFFNYKLESKIDEKIKFYNQYLNKKKYTTCLIHGDLSQNNVLLDSNGSIKLIDWTDARIDVPSHDIAQVFYLFKFDKKQQNFFLKNYGSTWIDKEIIEMHSLVFLIYDLASFWILHKKKNNFIMNQIKMILK